MREITKSVGSFSIALTLFGVQQAAGWARRLAPGETAPDGLEPVSRSTQDQLEGYLKNTFEAGDRMQRSAVDLAFGFLDGSAWNPSKALDLSATVLKDTVGAMTQLTLGSSSRRSSGQPCGWGPMPPAR